MKPIDFIYQDTEIHFLFGNEKNVMVNATEMAKAFGKRIDNFQRLEETKKFINALLNHENDKVATSDVSDQEKIYLTEKDIVNATNKGTYFHRVLALKFAGWLDTDFELWVYSKTEEVLFGNYKKHWDAHVIEKSSKLKMIELKRSLLLNPNPKDVFDYFKAEEQFMNAKMAKARAIKGQYQNDLFSTLEEEKM